MCSLAWPPKAMASTKGLIGCVEVLAIPFVAGWCTRWHRIFFMLFCVPRYSCDSFRRSLTAPTVKSQPAQPSKMFCNLLKPKKLIKKTHRNGFFYSSRTETEKVERLFVHFGFEEQQITRKVVPMHDMEAASLFACGVQAVHGHRRSIRHSPNTHWSTLAPPDCPDAFFCFSGATIFLFQSLTASCSTISPLSRLLYELHA